MFVCAAGKVKKGMCMQGNGCHRLQCGNEAPHDIIDEDNYKHLAPQVLIFPALNFHGCAANSSCKPLKPREQQHYFMNDLEHLPRTTRHGPFQDTT